LSENESKAAESKPTENRPQADRRRFIKYGVAGIIGAGVASAVEIPVLSNIARGESADVTSLKNQINGLNSQISGLNSQISQDKTQISNLQGQLTSTQGLAILTISEMKAIEALAETIIPSDSNGPGAKEAGVIYFIDKQLAGDYGNNARMYMKGPFVPSGQAGPITVDGITYPQGTPTVDFAGPKYQYSMSLRDFWRYGIEALESYANSVYGGNYETLNSDQQIQVLEDINDNKPTDFNGIVPKDFFDELVFMVYSGFLMDPLYGGNVGMVGWTYTGFTGANMGDTFNTGRDVLKLMVATTPTRYAPHSLGEFQKALNLIGGT
jgi:gluconate 2-dehydrogenase gamma chain